MLLRLFDTRKVDDFAQTLAQDLARRFPPSSESRTDKAAQSQLNVIVDGLKARALRFHEENRLGFFRKAKLGNTFRWRLKELGYSDSFIAEVTRSLVVELARRKKH